MSPWNAFVLSSLWEGLPCAVVEGRMLKLPVISYNTGGISDVIMHNKNGFLCEQKNWQKLAEYMLQLMRNEQMYNERAQFRDDLTNFQNTYMVQQHKLLYYRFQ